MHQFSTATFLKWLKEKMVSLLSIVGTEYKAFLVLAYIICAHTFNEEIFRLKHSALFKTLQELPSKTLAIKKSAVKETAFP